MRVDTMRAGGAGGQHINDQIGDSVCFDVLAAGAARPHGIDSHVQLLDVDIDAIVDHRINGNAGEGRVAPRVGVEK